MLIAVLAITSSAQAIFEEDFESYSVGEDVAKNGSGWASRAFDNYGKDNYAGAVVEVDSGTNGTQVGDLANSSAWGTPYYHLDAADQFSAGHVHFDMLNYGGASRTWFSDSLSGPGFNFQGGVYVMNLSWVSGEDIFERHPAGNVFDEITGGNRAVGAFTHSQWHSYRIDFDFDGGTGGNGEWSLFIDDGSSAILSGALTTDGSSGGRSLKTIGWGIASGDGPLLDNIVVKPIPEPASGLLILGGLACLLRRRA